MSIDSEMLDDARRLADHFGSQNVGVDYIVVPDGGQYDPEVNQVPDVSVFLYVRQVHLDLVARWASEPALA
jgi:hypothetical protein